MFTRASSQILGNLVFSIQSVSCKNSLENSLENFAVIFIVGSLSVTCISPISEAVDKVADRLLGPFNIEMLVRPINLKISEAIMNFQENSNDVSQRVFTGCGRPVLGRRRRRDNRELELESLNFDQETLTDDRAAILDKLVKETRQRVRDSRQFWVYLPYKVCNDGLVVPPSNTKECWNGTHVDK